MRLFILIGIFCFICTTPAFSQWLQFEDMTSTRLVLSAPYSNDSREKDLAVGDFDKDGWEDVVVVRKEPFSSPGAESDLLLMNNNGTLEDMTSTFAPDFISNTSDSRDVFVGDMDGDGWLDLVLANTFEDQPNLYLNKGQDTSSGTWLGFADSSTVRFPVLTIDPLQFCAVWGGDVTGNGALDLYFSNYAPSGGCDDVLLINDGSGHFTNDTSRLGNLSRSAFGTSVEIHDMDNDGDQDIVKISTLYGVSPWNDNGVFLLFNDGTGHFSNWVSVTESSAAPYMFTITDFNGDGKKDLYVVDDNQDYLRMAGSITADTMVTFTTTSISDPRTTGFGGNCKLADLDGDSDMDFGICDVDVDIPPCESGPVLRKFSLMKNQAGILSAPYGSGDSIWNVSSYDFAFLDLDNNGTPDVLQGLCTGYAVLMNTGQFVPCAQFTSSRIYVDSSATGASDGTSWSNAFTSLQQALLHAQNCSTLDSIFIAKGTYSPCSNGNRQVALNIPNGVTLLGGFPIGGGTLASRDPDIHITIFSGDIGLQDTINDNSIHVVEVGPGVSCTVNGITISNGRADGNATNAYGAGLLCAGSATLTDVKFTGNSGTDNGYVIYNTGTTLTFENCTVQTSPGTTKTPVYNAPGGIASFRGITMIK